MSIMDKINKWIGTHICGHKPIEVKPQEDVPSEVREKSHELANASARSNGLAHAVKKESEAIEQFARAIRGMHRHG